MITQNPLCTSQSYSRAAKIDLRSYIPSAKAVILEGNNHDIPKNFLVRIRFTRFRSAIAHLAGPGPGSPATLRTIVYATDIYSKIDT